MGDLYGPTEPLLFSRDNIHLYFGGEIPQSRVEPCVINPTGFKGGCIDLVCTIERAFSWMECPLRFDHDGFPVWVFSVRATLEDMKAFEALYSLYANPKKGPVRICGHLFESHHLGVIQMAEKMIEETEMTGQRCLKEDESRARQNMTGTYMPMVWINTGKSLLRKFSPIDTDDVFQGLLKEKERVYERYPHLNPVPFFGAPNLGKTEAIASSLNGEIRKQDMAVGWIVNAQREGLKINKATVARAVGIRRETLSREPGWNKVREAIRAANLPLDRLTRGLKTTDGRIEAAWDRDESDPED
ncbi:hypothetical protein K2X85_08575 [bacterium]|nr:hypothetical protein [bacterium]